MHFKNSARFPCQVMGRDWHCSICQCVSLSLRCVGIKRGGENIRLQCPTQFEELFRWNVPWEEAKNRTRCENLFRIVIGAFNADLVRRLDRNNQNILYYVLMQTWREKNFLSHINSLPFWDLTYFLLYWPLDHFHPQVCPWNVKLMSVAWPASLFSLA